ncbi:hypothetical protein AB0M58_01245 [Streptomyces bobili]|uniref:hypothetical protein n=1 Tax=Streptomyces bobili TaxID=67280 RepID=UPI0034441552
MPFPPSDMVAAFGRHLHFKSSGYASVDAPVSVIVHPRPSGHARRTLQARGPKGLLGTIHVLGVDTRATPEQATKWIGSVPH